MSDNEVLNELIKWLRKKSEEEVTPCADGDWYLGERVAYENALDKIKELKKKEEGLK